jgi:hypothetical protein
MYRLNGAFARDFAETFSEAWNHVQSPRIDYAWLGSNFLLILSGEPCYIIRRRRCGGDEK